MDAPTNIYGPDGTLCKKGAPIPADWFDKLPDLQTHLDVIAAGGDITVAEPTETVAADMTVKRERGSS